MITHWPLGFPPVGPIETQLARRKLGLNEDELLPVRLFNSASF